MTAEVVVMPVPEHQVKQINDLKKMGGTLKSYKRKMEDKIKHLQERTAEILKKSDNLGKMKDVLSQKTNDMKSD